MMFRTTGIFLIFVILQCPSAYAEDPSQTQIQNRINALIQERRSTDPWKANAINDIRSGDYGSIDRAKIAIRVHAPLSKSDARDLRKELLLQLKVSDPSTLAVVLECLQKLGEASAAEIAQVKQQFVAANKNSSVAADYIPTIFAMGGYKQTDIAGLIELAQKEINFQAKVSYVVAQIALQNGISFGKLLEKELATTPNYFRARIAEAYADLGDDPSIPQFVLGLLADSENNTALGVEIANRLKDSPSAVLHALMQTFLKAKHRDDDSVILAILNRELKGKPENQKTIESALAAKDPSNRMQALRFALGYEMTGEHPAKIKPAWVIFNRDLGSDGIPGIVGFEGRIVCAEQFHGVIPSGARYADQSTIGIAGDDVVLKSMADWSATEKTRIEAALASTRSEYKKLLSSKQKYPYSENVTYSRSKGREFVVRTGIFSDTPNPELNEDGMFAFVPNAFIQVFELIGNKPTLLYSDQTQGGSGDSSYNRYHDGFVILSHGDKPYLIVEETGWEIHQISAARIVDQKNISVEARCDVRLQKF